ncbi:MAG: hypothetical protein E6Q76_03750 [Rhizobium sp.]|nr:MAG: hypothetical protein E6Q76_03750 [Rhizobium sp.]
MTMTSTKTLGIQGRLLVGTPGVTPTDVLEDETDVNLDCNNSMAKKVTRGKPRASNRPTTQELAMDFTVVKDFGNALFLTLYTAAMNREAVAIKALDKDSGYGWDADWYVSFKEGQPLEGWDTTQFTCAFTDDYRDLTEILPD